MLYFAGSVSHMAYTVDTVLDNVTCSRGMVGSPHGRRVEAARMGLVGSPNMQ